MRNRINTPEGRKEWRDELEGDLLRLFAEIEEAYELVENNELSWACVARIEDEIDDCQEALRDIERTMFSIGELSDYSSLGEL